MPLPSISGVFGQIASSCWTLQRGQNHACAFATENPPTTTTAENNFNILIELIAAFSLSVFEMVFNSVFYKACQCFTDFIEKYRNETKPTGKGKIREN